MKQRAVAFVRAFAGAEERMLQLPRASGLARRSEGFVGEQVKRRLHVRRMVSLSSGEKASEGVAWSELTQKPAEMLLLQGRASKEARQQVPARS